MRRCRALAVLVALLAVSLAPGAAAQTTIRLTATPEAVEATPGSPALFDLELANDGLFAATLRLDVSNFSAGWTYNLSASTVTVEPGKRAHVTFTAFTPSGAQPGTSGTFVVSARRESTDIEAGTPVTVRVDVVAPAQTTSTSATPPPELALVATPSSAAPGEEARGTLTIYNGEGRDLRVNLAILGDTVWSPRTGLAFLVVQPDTTRQVDLIANVPLGVANGTERAFDIRATTDIDDTVFAYTWRVTAIGESAPAPQGEAETPPKTGNGASTTPGSTPESSDATAPDASFAARLLESVVSVPAGSTSRSTLFLSNPTLDPVTVRLSGEAPEGWIVQFEADAIHLTPGESRQVWVSVAAPADVIPGGRGPAAIVAQAADAPAQRVTFDVEPLPALTTARDTTAAAAATSDTGDAPLAQPAVDSTLLGLALGAGAVGAGALVVGRRRSREALLWGAVGLYTRLLRPDILRHEERERLHELIQGQPGIHFHALQRELDWNTGTLTYHLRVLERHSFITSRRDGLLRRFYVVGAAPRQETFDGPTGLRADVLEAVRNQAGISQSDLTLALGANKQTVNYHVKALERQGLLRIEKRGRDTFLYADASVHAMRGESASA